MFRRFVAALAAIVCAASAGGASASSGSWTGFWTWYAAPAPGHWVWTWVWLSAAPGGLLVGPQLDGARPRSASDGCCAITIDNFGGAERSSVTLTGPLAANFLSGVAANNNVLQLEEPVVEPPFTPEQLLGTMVYDDPDFGPKTQPPEKPAKTGRPDFRMMLATNGHTAGVDSVITGAPSVPEPAEWAMLLAGLAVLGGRLRRSRASASSVSA